MNGYPILLEMTRRKVLLVGGGPVAARKAMGVLEAGATNVECISPVFDLSMPVQVTRRTGLYGQDFGNDALEGVGLCFAATNVPEVNAKVVDDCRVRGVLVSRADVDDETPQAMGDFTSLAAIRRGRLLAGVSASGVPLLAAALRDVIASVLTIEMQELAEVNIKLRGVIRRAIPPGPRRSSAMRKMAGSEAIDIIRQSGVAGLERWMLEAYPELSTDMASHHTGQPAQQSGQAKGLGMQGGGEVRP